MALCPVQSVQGDAAKSRMGAADVSSPAPVPGALGLHVGLLVAAILLLGVCLAIGQGRGGMGGQ